MQVKNYCDISVDLMAEEQQVIKVLKDGSQTPKKVTYFLDQNHRHSLASITDTFKKYSVVNVSNKNWDQMQAEQLSYMTVELMVEEQ